MRYLSHFYSDVYSLFSDIFGLGAFSGWCPAIYGASIFELAYISGIFF
jgi:hypothetical protein